MKKITAVSLCIIMLLPMLFTASFAAVSENAGMSAIRAQWSRGEGPKKDGYDIDYSFFSPIANGSSDEKEYPLLVILPGFGESTYEGEELTANEFPLWSSKEYQEKFYNGGAYIIIARAPEEAALFWDSALPIPALKAAIEDFCVENRNVDTNRIYVMGWSLGATGATRLTANYDNFIAAALIFSPIYAMSNKEADACRNKAVWLFGCKKDSIAIYDLYTKASWNNLLDNSLDYSKIRFTTTETAPNTPMLLHHNTWDLALRDMTDNGGCTGVNTIDGYGDVIVNPSVIEWLSEQSLVVEEEIETCSHICHKGGISGFFYKIIRLFWQLFGMNKTCSCGLDHY
ncbi:MAG: hypothetical protein IKL10_09365 [Clostridia bacterium]|nr:hypothetical protein [Clostridia bacterium]